MFRYSVPAKLSSLGPVQDYLTKSLPKEFASQLSNLLLVSEELLVNVFSYAYPEGEKGDAEISLDVIHIDATPKLRLTVKDWGAPFNPFEEIVSPDISLDIDSRPIGGLGVFLIKAVTETQKYSFVDGANIIETTFGLHPVEVQ